MAERASAWTAGLLGEPLSWEWIPSTSTGPLDPVSPAIGSRFQRDRTAESLLFADIAGNLNAPAPFDPIWLAWNDGTVRHLAEAIYDGRDWEQMPILADALEDAGCQDERILGHCRGGSLHVRGCWVVDQVLGLK